MSPTRKGDGVNRRDFLKLGNGLAAAGAVSSLGVASLAFIWPPSRGGGGALVPLMTADELNAEIDDNDGRFEAPEAKSLIVRYDPALDPEGVYAEVTGDQAIPFMAMYQFCVHLGCKVPWCVTSQWWECPCHGSQYNRWGEWQGGPAPRGLDRYAVEEVDGIINVNRTALFTGPSRGAGALAQPAEGPNCA